MAKKTGTVKKKVVKVGAVGNAYVHSTFNNVIITINNACYDNVELRGTDQLTVRPKPVPPPGTDFFQNKIYDGTSLLAGKSFTYQDVKGQQITVQRPN